MASLTYHPHQPLTHGVEEDVKKLVSETVELFDENEELRISHFQVVWKRMKFGLVSVFFFFAKFRYFPKP